MSQKKMLLIKKAIWLTGRRMLCNIISQWKYQDRRIDASQAEKEIFKQEIIWRKDIRSYVLWKHTSWVLLFNISHVLYWYTRFFNHSSRWKDIFANTMSHASRNMPCKEKESRQEIICLKRLTVSRKHTSHQSMSYKAYPSRIDIYCSWIIRLNKICLIFKYKLNLKIVYLLIHKQRKYLTDKSKISYVSDHHTNVL